ncbi:MAG: hypothetical protein HKN35_15925 [Woeseia sp.]|nr:hypothetical protein [Woeseia sp.]
MTPDDGVVEVPIPIPEENNMPAPDLSEAVANHLLTESVGNIQANNRDGRNIGTTAMGVLQLAAARNFDELGTVEGRANSGVNATPIAAPAVPQ